MAKCLALFLYRLQEEVLNIQVHVLLLVSLGEWYASPVLHQIYSHSPLTKVTLTLDLQALSLHKFHPTPLLPFSSKV